MHLFLLFHESLDMINASVKLEKQTEIVFSRQYQIDFFPSPSSALAWSRDGISQDWMNGISIQHLIRVRCTWFDDAIAHGQNDWKFNKIPKKLKIVNERSELLKSNQTIALHRNILRSLWNAEELSGSISQPASVNEFCVERQKVVRRKIFGLRNQTMTVTDTNNYLPAIYTFRRRLLPPSTSRQS